MPTVIVVLPFPALLNVAVSPTPGTGEADQLVVVNQSPFVVPFQLALAAHTDGESRSVARNAANAAKDRRGGVGFILLGCC